MQVLPAGDRQDKGTRRFASPKPVLLVDQVADVLAGCWTAAGEGSFFFFVLIQEHFDIFYESEY